MRECVRFRCNFQKVLELRVAQSQLPNPNVVLTEGEYDAEGNGMRREPAVLRQCLRRRKAMERRDVAIEVQHSPRATIRRIISPRLLLCLIEEVEHAGGGQY